MLPPKEFYSINEGDKDGEYADKMIRFVRQNMQPLVSREKARIGLDYLLARQNMSNTEELFQDPSRLNLGDQTRAPVPLVNATGEPIGKNTKGIRNDMNGVDFVSMPVLIKVKNVVTAEMKKMGAIISVRANDPTSSSKRKIDEVLIKKKKSIEALLTYVYQSIGEKEPVSLSEHKARFGDKPDSGNTGDFDKMQLSSDDPDDVSFFFDNFYKLDWEIEMQKALDAIMSFNEVEQNNIDSFVIDAMAKNAIAGQIYVSDENGAISIDYLTPETVYIYGSTHRRRDYNDAMAKAYEQNVTIKQFIDRVGAAFDFEANLDSMMLAVFYASNGAIDITGINPDFGGVGNSGDWYCKGRSGQPYSHSDFMNFNVCVGYMEWTSQNYTEYGNSLKGKGKKFDYDKKTKQNTATTFTTANYQNPDGEKYPTQARYECPTYKSYYLALTSFQHVKFKFGKVSYQDIKGYNDFNSNFSIITWKEVGDPIAIMAIPMIDIINEAFYKWRWILRKSKAPGTDYNVESLEKIADSIFCDTDGRENRIQKTIEWMDSSSNRLWSFPIGDDGRPIMMTNNMLNIDVKNGLGDNFMKYWETMTVTWDKLIDMIIGHSDLRQGESTANRSSTTNEFKALEYSQNSTSYIPNMITFFFKSAAVRSGMILQDIIQYKDYDTLAYKFLQDLVGDEALDKIANMGKTAMHRYGINVESFSQAPRLAKLSQRIDFAIANGKLSNAQALLIEDMKSPNLAYRTLAYFEMRNDKIKQKQAMQLQQQQGQQEQQIEAMRQKTEMIKGDYNVLVAKIQSEATQNAHIINQQGGITKTAMKTQADSEQIVQQSMANMAELQHENNLSKQQPTPNIPQPPMPASPSSPLGPTSTQPPIRSRDALMEQVQPGPAVQQ